MYQAYEAVKISETKQTVGTGWLPPMLDTRDYTEESEDIPDGQGIGCLARCFASQEGGSQEMVLAHRKPVAARFLYR